MQYYSLNVNEVILPVLYLLPRTRIIEITTHNIHYRQVVRPKPVDATTDLNYTEIKFSHHASPSYATV